jgi:predicted CoA-binding protein
VTGTDAIVERILTRYDTIPVNPYADQLLGEPANRTLAGIPEQRRLNLDAPAPG